MQNTIPNSIWTNRNNVNVTTGSGPTMTIDGDLKSIVKDNALIVFAKKGCCMSHVVQRLLQALGANPTVYEVEVKDVDHVLLQPQKVNPGGVVKEGRLQFPVVIGGWWFSGLDRISAIHITEELTPC